MANGSVLFSAVAQPERLSASQVNVAGSTMLIGHNGPGVFVSGNVIVPNGNDQAVIVLEMDQQEIIKISFAQAEDWGYTRLNPSGIMLLRSFSGYQNLVIGHAATLIFRNSFKLSIDPMGQMISELQATALIGG